MFYDLRRKLNHAQFNISCRGIHRTPPLVLKETGCSVLSQIRGSELVMYLIAVKSFAKRVDVNEVYLVDDGLTEADRATLLEHIRGIHILDIANYRRQHCPSGGTWERLLAIAELNASRYVVQLDSDTLSIGPLNKISTCVAQSTSFVIGTYDHQDFDTMTAHQVAGAESAKIHHHIQALAEASFDKLHGFPNMRYVRGCSGFTGFRPGALSVEMVQDLSEQMYAAVGPRWNEWGTEQVMSNLLVSNSGPAIVLPHPEYCNCTAISNKTEFIHFIGYCRFKGNTYARLANGFIGA